MMELAISYFLLVVNSCLFLFYAYKNLTLLVLHYYSIKRFVKLKVQFFKRNSKKLVVIILINVLTFLLLLWKNHMCFHILYTLELLLFVVFCSKESYHVTKRMLRIEIIGLISFFVTISLLVLEHSITNVLLVFNAFGLYIFVFGVFILSLPFEFIIKRFYLNSAKRKIRSIPNLKIIGVTGSFGKTTFKNYLRSILSAKYLVSTPKKNTNTLMGITKFINEELRLDSDILLIELGIDELNGMKKFKKLLNLDIAIITTIGKMHLSTFKNLDNIIKGKANISTLLKKEGILFFNKEIPYYSKDYFDCLCCDFEKEYQFKKMDDLRYQITYASESIVLPIYLKPALTSLCGAIKIGIYLKLTDKQIIEGLKRIKSTERRFEIKHYKGKIIVDNSYNINQIGLLDTIDNIKMLKGTKAVLLGELIELDKDNEKTNYQIGQLLSSFDLLYFIGEESHPLVKGFLDKSSGKVVCDKDYHKAYEQLLNSNYKNILLLPKGSNNSLS